MVFERDIPSCSPSEVLNRYLRRTLIDNYNKSKTELTAIVFTLHLPLLRSSGSSCSVNSGGTLPSIWGWSHHMRNLSQDALFANCPFLQIACFAMPFCVLPFSVCASLRTAFLRYALLLVASLHYASLRVAFWCDAFFSLDSGFFSILFTYDSGFFSISSF